MKLHGCAYTGGGKWIEPRSGFECDLSFPCVNISSGPDKQIKHVCIGEDVEDNTNVKNKPKQIETVDAFGGKTLTNVKNSSLGGDNLLSMI